MARSRRKGKSKAMEENKEPCMLGIIARLEAGDIKIETYLLDPAQPGHKLFLHEGAGIVGLPDDLKLPEFMSRRQMTQACSFVRLPLPFITPAPAPAPVVVTEETAKVDDVAKPE
jgi:hypothetical protein